MTEKFDLWELWKNGKVYYCQSYDDFTLAKARAKVLREQQKQDNSFEPADPKYERHYEVRQNKKVLYSTVGKKIAVSGGFAPVHIGHIKLLKAAADLGRLIVILNTDDFLMRKKGYVFMPLAERKLVLESIRFVDTVFVSIDTDMSVRKSLEVLKPDIFANGGDRKSEADILECEVCKRLGIEMVFGIGGFDKPQSSSWLVKSVGHV